MTEELHEVKEGDSQYIRPQLAANIKQALMQDAELAKQIYSWLRLSGLKITDY